MNFRKFSFPYLLSVSNLPDEECPTVTRSRSSAWPRDALAATLRDAS